LTDTNTCIVKIRIPEPLIGYYRSFDINKGSLVISAYEDGVRVLKIFGIVKAAYFAKVQVDLLGKVSR
jgi:hypothetical protein